MKHDKRASHQTSHARKTGMIHLNIQKFFMFRPSHFRCCVTKETRILLFHTNPLSISTGEAINVVI